MKKKQINTQNIPWILKDIPEVKAKIHEHQGSIALSIGDNETVILNWYLAEKLAAELKIAAKQIQHANHYEPTEITL